MAALLAVLRRSGLLTEVSHARLARRAVGYLLPPLLLFAALLLLRRELLQAVNVTEEQAIASGLRRGYYFDFLVVWFPIVVAQTLWALVSAPRRVVWSLVAFLVWFANLANLLHYRFFGTRLDWWIVSAHWDDFFTVQDSAAQLGLSPLIGASIATLVVAIGTALWRRPWDHPRPVAPRGRWWSWRTRRLGWALLVLAACFVVWRTPRWILGRRSSDVLSDNIVRVWISQNTSQNLHAGVDRRWYDEVAGEPLDDRTRPNRLLLRYQRFDDSQPPELPLDLFPVGAEGEWLLARELVPDAELTRARRAQLGLPAEGPVNVILLFLESVRAFELYHPELGPQVFPRLRALLDGHALQFRQAYSSSFTAGQTVRGQFSTLCSMLPNITGAATYIAHSTLRVQCLMSAFQRVGYTTAWMNTHRSHYHGKRTFETLHGTALFFEGKDFRARGVTERKGTWGLADAPFLREVVTLAEELTAPGKPLFANVLTISAHHPYSYVAGGELPAALEQATRGHEYYRQYLSRLIYEDSALAEFFARLFESPVAERTVVALVADHSSPVPPHLQVNARQLEEIRFRVPFAFITRDLPQPAVIDTPVHQVDMAPALANIVGLAGPITWVGRDPLAGGGSPWVYQRGDQVMYRTARRGCYPEGAGRALSCWDVSAGDPMYAAELPSVPVDEKLTDFFREVVRANRLAIVHNLVEPPPGTAGRAARPAGR